MSIDNKVKNYAKTISTGILLAGLIYAPRLNKETYIATVKNSCISYQEFKENPFSEFNEFTIHTKLENGNNKVFNNKNSYLRLKFDSKKIQEKIETGNTYRFEVYGFEKSSLLTKIYGTQNVTDVKKIN